MDAGRNPAIIAGPEVVSTSRERAAGFLAEWREARPDFEPHISYLEFSHQCGRDFCAEVMSSKDPPDAIFATNDYTAFGVLDEAKRMGIRVPEDLWVVGYDDIYMSDWSPFDLTTVRQPTAKMAQVAVRLLLARIGSRDWPTESVRLEVELVIRGSTAFHQ